MNRKNLILIGIVAIILLVGGIFWLNETNIPQTTTQSNQEEQEKETPVIADIDTSDWKTYRNEEYGFEFKLSDEYSLPENFGNTTADDSNKNVLILKNGIKEFDFSSKKGQKIISEVAGKGDAGDSWRVTVKIHQSVFDERDFRGWVDRNSNVDVEGIGQKMLRSGNLVQYVSWGSICNDYSAFFKKDRFVIEFNTCGSQFFSDNKEDYFSAILNSVSFSN